MRPLPAALLALLLLLVSPAAAQAVDLVFTGSDGTTTQELRLGLDPAATVGLDAGLGEAELPPFPPSGVFEARFVGSNVPAELGQGSYRDYRPGAADFSGAVEHALQWQLGTGASAFALGYDLPDGVSVLVEDFFGGVVLSETLTGSGEIEVTNTSLTQAKLTVTFPDSNTPPRFTSTPVTSGEVGVPYSYSVTATDADGDPLTLTAPTLPSWLSFTDNGDGTGTLSGTPATAEDFDVVLRASDGTAAVEQRFTVTVAAAESISLPITFEESIDYELQDFDGTTTTVVADPTDATNTVAQTNRAAAAACFAGTTVANTTGFDSAIPFTADATTMSVDVWSPEAGVLVLFKVEDKDNAALFVETYTYTTVAGGWETMVFDFGDPKPNGAPIQVGGNYNKATIFFDFQCDNVPPTTLPAADRTYYWDNVAFGGEAGGGDPEDFAGYLLGVNEVPAVETGAAGFVEATLDGNDLTVTGSFAGLESDYLFSHLHQAPAGGNGPVVVALNPTMSADNRSGVFDETVTLEAAAVNALRAGEVYVNVHSETFGGGELRAQLVMDPAIAAVTLIQARNSGPGVSVSVSGTVSRAMGDFTYFQDATGGLVIRQTSGGFFDDVASGAITGGSTIEVTGELSEFRALLQINGSDLAAYSVTGTADVPEAQQVTLADLAASGEAYESELVFVRGLTFADAGDTFAAGRNYDVDDGSGGAVQVRVISADDTEVDGLAIPPANSNVTGVVGQFDREAPFTDGYQIQPILATDIRPGVNNPPAASTITSPADGSTVTIAGDPGAVVTAAWSESTDAEGDPITYRWELSDSRVFTRFLLSAATSATSTAFTQGELADALTGIGVGSGETVTLYHRVTTSDGTSSTTGPRSRLVVERGALTASGEIPTEFALVGGYPNPTTGGFTVRLDLPMAGAVRLEMFDVLGRRVHAVAVAALSAGAGQTFELGVDRLRAGTYIYRVTAEFDSGVEMRSGRLTVTR